MLDLPSHCPLRRDRRDDRLDCLPAVSWLGKRWIAQYFIGGRPLLGAFILLGTQLAFELRSTETVSVFKTEFTTDNEQPKIEQFRYPMSSRQRPLDESEANKFLLETTPSAFKGDGEKLWKDMSLLSLVLYLWSEQHDWQIARDVLGGYERFQYQSKPDQRDQCTKVGWEMIQGMLRQANNAFADFKPTGLFQFMCLPPRSSIDVRPSTVLIKTPFCQIRIDIEELWISRHSEMPGTNDMPMTKDNRPRFETRTGIIRTTVKYDWILAQSREMPKHETWANDVVERARKWFDPEFPAGKQYIS
jgi:hypothetical protein